MGRLEDLDELLPAVGTAQQNLVVAMWAATSASIGQLAVLALVVSIVRSVNKRGRALR